MEEVASVGGVTVEGRAAHFTCNFSIWVGVAAGEGGVTAPF